MEKRLNQPRPEPLGDQLSRLYGLTPAEVRLALAFLSEASIKQAAGRESITQGSARQYIKSIFKKTGTHNQAQLIKLLMQSQTREQHRAIRSRQDLSNRPT